MNDKLHNKMMEMVDKAGRKGLSSNVPFKEEQFSELVNCASYQFCKAPISHRQPR